MSFFLFRNTTLCGRNGSILESQETTISNNIGTSINATREGSLQSNSSSQSPFATQNGSEGHTPKITTSPMIDFTSSNFSFSSSTSQERKGTSVICMMLFNQSFVNVTLEQFERDWNLTGLEVV